MLHGFLLHDAKRTAAADRAVSARRWPGSDFARVQGHRSIISATAEKGLVTPHCLVLIAMAVPAAMNARHATVLRMLRSAPGCARKR